MGRGEVAAREMLLMEAASRKRKIIVDHVLDAIDGRLKVCVFTGRRIDVESLRASVAKKAGQCPIWSWTGSDTPEDRELMRRSYMASPGPAVLIATGESSGEGIDLQDVDLAILAMLPYTPGQVIQYEGRWIRLGMKRPVLIRYFIAEGTIDEHVAAILLGKLPAIEKTVDLDEVRGLASEMLGDESELLQSMAAKVLGG
jgi:superfamily II DNA/RNA helicase